MAAIIAAEQENEDGISKPCRISKCKLKPPAVVKENGAMADSDNEDSNFEMVPGDSCLGSDTKLDGEISNEELSANLLSKTDSSNSCKKSYRKGKGKDDSGSSQDPKGKRKAVEIKDPTDEEQCIAAGSGSGDPGGLSTSISGRGSRKRNPIYYFYEQVPTNSDGKPGAYGDKHYRCYHGKCKVLTITRAMKRSLNELIGHLHELPAPDEIEIASGKKVLDADTVAEYLGKLEAATETIVQAFQKQAAAAMEKFEQLLAEWIVACDQPFDKVTKPEFWALLTYTHHPSPTLNIPGQKAIQNRIMKMGESLREELKALFDEKFLYHLTHRYRAMVMHSWLLLLITSLIKASSEILIDFRELPGKIMAFVMDNASNNDTIMDAIKHFC
ncbi:hypothetical protein Moror_8534 [Moniliophthora roreri MCA 2997]|uniref:Uncharacterized protein n=1 Tax=Moniliophthora roreri (strain MCA 2997) TaxID=1381753 RepID=V2WLL7_MONRO|nr:hypothetical protein Moror_8534 [Moniliophthora roreri MCA 2997]